jgi:quercetin dioxygenase-like cupin family protein
MRWKCLSICAIFAGVSAAQVPIDDEPRHHLEFASQSLRVISPQIPPGDTTLEHIHTHDETTVCIHGSSTRGKPHDGEWGKAGMPCVPGTAGLTEYTGKPRSHTVQNVGSDPFRLLLVENLRESGWQNNQALDSPGLKVFRENRSFRIYNADFSGSGVEEHVHEVPAVVVLVSGEAKVGAKRLDQPGQWALVPAGEKHRVDAHGDARVIEIEVR